MREINASIPFDKALWQQDIAASKAHVAMLGAQGIVTSEDAATISEGLDRIAEEYARDGVPEDWDLEDIHMTTESRLAELIGPTAGRLHTARSRNDQVATDFRLWVRQAIDEADAGLEALQRALVDPRRRARGEYHARLHAFADRAACDARPSSHGLLRDDPARPQSLRRRARTRMNESPLWVAQRSPEQASRSIAMQRRKRLDSTGPLRIALMQCPTATSRSIT